MSDEMMKISKEDLIKALIKSKENNLVDKDELITRLKKLFTRLTEEYKFKPGDLVVWKEGLKNKKMPPYNLPAIVIEHLEEPIIADIDESGSPYFREPLDLIAGFIDGDSFVIFHFDSRRFKKYEGN